MKKSELLHNLRDITPISTWEEVKEQVKSQYNGNDVRFPDRLYPSTIEFIDNENCDHSEDYDFITEKELPEGQYEEVFTDNTYNWYTPMSDDLEIRVYRQISSAKEKIEDDFDFDTVYAFVSLNTGNSPMYGYSDWFIMKFDNDYDDGGSVIEFFGDLCEVDYLETPIGDIGIDVYSDSCEFSIYNHNNFKSLDGVYLDLDSRKGLIELLADALEKENWITDKKEFINKTLEMNQVK